MTTNPGPNNPFENDPRHRSAASDEVLSGEVVSDGHNDTTGAGSHAAGSHQAGSPGPSGGSTGGHTGGPTHSDGPRYVRSEPMSNNPFNRNFYGPPGSFDAYRSGQSPLGGVGLDPATLRLKNPLIAGMLGLLLGPIGLLYSNILWAIFLGIVVVGLINAHAVLWLFIPPIFLLCAIIGFASSLRTNWKRIMSAVEEHSDGQAGPGGMTVYYRQ